MVTVTYGYFRGFYVFTFLLHGFYLKAIAKPVELWSIWLIFRTPRVPLRETRQKHSMAFPRNFFYESYKSKKQFIFNVLF